MSKISSYKNNNETAFATFSLIQEIQGNIKLDYHGVWKRLSAWSQLLMSTYLSAQNAVDINSKSNSTKEDDWDWTRACLRRNVRICPVYFIASLGQCGLLQVSTEGGQSAIPWHLDVPDENLSVRIKLRVSKFRWTMENTHGGFIDNY